MVHFFPTIIELWAGAERKEEYKKKIEKEERKIRAYLKKYATKAYKKFDKKYEKNKNKQNGDYLLAKYAKKIGIEIEKEYPNFHRILTYKKLMRRVNNRSIGLVVPQDAVKTVVQKWRDIRIDERQPHLEILQMHKTELLNIPDMNRVKHLLEAA